MFSFSPMDSLKVCLKTFCRIWELHNKGWLHRDIKGSNFVVGAPPDDERIYILDFGLSRPKR
jgi:serine/threonine protein kinase